MATAQPVLRLATWNLRSGISVDPPSLWWRRRPSVARVLGAVGADVWCFQEVFSFQRRWVLRHGLPGGPWGHAGHGRNRRHRGEAVPVAWRAPVVRPVRAQTFWLGPRPDAPGAVAPGASSPRVVTVVDLAVHGVSTVRVVNTHLDDRTPEARRSAAAQIAGWVAARGDDVPLVVAGDLNATLDDDELGPLLESGLVPTLAPSAGPTATAFETEPGRRLDHLLVSRHWEVLRSDVVTSAGRASDHYPVVADLRLL